MTKTSFSTEKGSFAGNIIIHAPLAFVIVKKKQ